MQLINNTKINPLREFQQKPSSVNPVGISSICSTVLPKDFCLWLPSARVTELTRKGFTG